MSKFIVEDSFWNLFPQGTIGVVLMDGMNNEGESSQEIKNILDQGNREASKFLTEEKFNENPVIALWRNAYQQFKTKKGVRSSIEALLKRTEKNNPVESINPLVDIYNGISLKYGLPCGAEDKDTFAGNLVLGITEGGDEFYLIGDEENSPTLPGELCYRDDVGAVCRCFNWRDGERTMITGNSKNAFVVIETVETSQLEPMKSALEELREYGSKLLGADAKIFLLTKENPQIDL